jgi:hypothetical protein
MRSTRSGSVLSRFIGAVALLLPDRTQLRLNQNGRMRIKTVAGTCLQASCYALTDAVIL